MISGQERLACMDDAAGLRDALGVRLPESLPEIYLHRVSYPLRDLFLRYLRAHALVTAEQLAHEFSLGIAIVEEQLQQLREQGLVMNLQQDIWVSDEVFRRLRLRSLQAAREATRPVAATTYARLLLERQGVLPATDGSPALFASTSPGVYEGRGWRDAGDRTACRSRFTRLTLGKPDPACPRTRLFARNAR